MFKNSSLIFSQKKKFFTYSKLVIFLPRNLSRPVATLGLTQNILIFINFIFFNLMIEMERVNEQGNGTSGWHVD